MRRRSTAQLKTKAGNSGGALLAGPPQARGEPTSSVARVCAWRPRYHGSVPTLLTQLSCKSAVLRVNDRLQDASVILLRPRAILSLSSGCELKGGKEQVSFLFCVSLLSPFSSFGRGVMTKVLLTLAERAHAHT